MTLNKKMLAGKLMILFIPFIAYVLVSLAGLELWSNITSPVCAFLAAGILFYAYRSDRIHKPAVVFLCFSFACLSWAIADSIWLVITLYDQDPMANAVVSIFYLLTNCFILVPFIISAALQFKKWNAIQITADIITLMIASAMLMWIVFFNKDISIVIRLIKLDFTSVFSLVTDFLILFGMLFWLLAVRSVKLPGFFKTMLMGTGLYAIADTVYYYTVLHNIYIPNSFIDIVYILTLDVISLGALLKVYEGRTFDITAHSNVGRRKKWFVLILIPVLIITLSIFRIVDIKLEPIDFVQFAVLFVLYAVFSSHVQISIEKETIMKRQNNEMEHRISNQLRELDYLANQDTLTALYNQSYFAGRIDETVGSLLPNETMALMVIDLDRFKTINGRFGYEVGDIVLIEIAQRLAECNDWGAVISRFGSDEFGVLVVGKYTRKEIEDICDRIIGICRTPISAGGELLEVTMSMGVSLYSPEACERGTLFKNADIAMHCAKSHGYNKYLFYDPLLAENINKKNEIEVLLRQAEVGKDFQLFYQPQYSLPELKLVGAEALIRWKNAQHGYIPPDVFIPVVEEIDYIFKLGRWVVQETVRQTADWNGHYRGDLKIGFNISPK